MRRFYQSEWQGIRFADFWKPSHTEIAGPEFYQAFYKEFFDRYYNWEQLPAAWLEEKRRCADFVLARCGAKSVSVLSVGCGLGAVEHFLCGENPKLELFVHEVASSAWRWVAAEFADDHRLLGQIPACLPVGAKYDLVYFSAVEYAMDDDTLVQLLASIKPYLHTGGQCIMISASFMETDANRRDKAAAYLRSIKRYAAEILDALGLRQRQLWGWMRTQEEFHRLMLRAGYSHLNDGFIDPNRRANYWIAGW